MKLFLFEKLDEVAHGGHIDTHRARQKHPVTAGRYLAYLNRENGLFLQMQSSHHTGRFTCLNKSNTQPGRCVRTEPHVPPHPLCDADADGRNSSCFLSALKAAQQQRCSRHCSWVAPRQVSPSTSADGNDSSPVPYATPPRRQMEHNPRASRNCSPVITIRSTRWREQSVFHVLLCVQRQLVGITPVTAIGRP